MVKSLVLFPPVSPVMNRRLHQASSSVQINVPENNVSKRAGHQITAHLHVETSG